MKNMTKESVIKKFTSLNGVGNAKAELLHTSGFDSIDKLKNATVDDLKNIKGITEKKRKRHPQSIKRNREKRNKTKNQSKT